MKDIDWNKSWRRNKKCVLQTEFLLEVSLAGLRLGSTDSLLLSCHSQNHERAQ